MNGHNGPKTYDMTNFTIREITECGRALRLIGAGAATMEETADRIARYLHETLTDGETGARACSLVRFFKTQAFENLADDLKAFALQSLGAKTPKPGMKCLTLLGTAGENKEWNSRETSRNHKVIPLPSVDVVRQIPMIRNIIKQFGMSVNSVVRPDPSLLLDMEQKNYGVFLVPNARGSLNIPAQNDFVVPYMIKSVVGFGGMLPSLDIFVVIMFLKTAVSRETADLFKNLSLNIKLAILPFERNIFVSERRLDI